MTIIGLPPSGLLGRRSECEVLARLVTGLRAGQSRVLVLRGEAGAGKTALLEHLAASASGCRIARAVGVESEMELPFAGLHALCAPMLGRLGHLPGPQREALNTAFGLSVGPPPARFLVGLAALSLLADTAEEQPLVCIVDDAQWLDQVSAQTLAFVGRRLLAERVGLVFGLRESGLQHEFEGLPELVVAGLAAEDARVLLDAAFPGPLDERVQERILGEAGGNPLALIELPRGLTPAELAGGFGLADARPLASRIERTFLQRVQSLPRDSQLLLLTAAAEPLGDASLLWRAAGRLGIGDDAARRAEGARLIELGARVRFPHPLVRSAVYGASAPGDRRDVHRALADSTDPVLDPDRRAWHRAHATATADEAVAAEMVHSADRAQRRGGLAAAAAFLERAAELTPDPGRRVERALDAAQAKLDVADPGAAYELIAAAKLGPLDELQRARLERLIAQIVFARRRGRDAPPLLLQAAKRLEPLDAAMARETYLDAMAAAMFAGRLGTGPDEREVAEVARATNPVYVSGAAEALLDALVTRFTEGYAASVSPLSQALRAFGESDGGKADRRWLWLACRLAQDLWDDELWDVLATRGARLARDAGALSLLAVMANYLAALHVHSGAFATAAALIDEVDAITEATGLPPLKYASLMLAASRGEEAQALFEDAWRNGMERGEGSGLGLILWLTALRHNADGRYGEALADAQRACEHEDVMAYGWALVEQIEAGVRVGRPDEAAAALDRLSERTQASGTEWALGIEARCRALVSDDEVLYRESIERLARSRAALELARSRLLYGEWLRRENRRTDARELLRAAHDSFSHMGAEGFAERARRELRATGETVRRVTADTRDVLTPQEVQVARLARDGHTNPEIGAQLFISPRTVEYHLHKVFRKLDVNTRKELRAALAEQPA
ncbi:LuxR C-terminal-related transcriptional regulator [Solirubrobacter ginsenosidimutans]|uniref:LuxR C-terminal-related transcriptional regulator n=1 Tax=Solirubrobacter ginsenosidimutans TaxID=490573 RepID=A0A9X3N8E5_9ACTN|nr:LuxR family transcriptional regulator [Solirubrobacter ginsenosidimutans]MDA0166733.1 LuxR C-terminal-related transcriptional regulator [Solirubrobacter ginsenosidimutans]